MRRKEQEMGAARGRRSVRFVRGLAGACGVVALMLVGVARAKDYSPPAFTEPVVLKSEGGVLEVSLFARQGSATLDTVAKPVSNFLLFGYEIQRGTASNGKRTDANLYPGPTLQVAPGDTLIVHMANELADLTIPDFYDPAFIAKDKPVPLYPRQLTRSPFNLHTHGLHVSPKGNSDNVLLDIPPGYTNTYTYRIPADHPQGAYWYHSHRHTLTAQHTYLGLAGLLLVGRADGDIPLVSKHKIPVRNMLIQYNYVFDRKGGQAILNDVTWPQFVSTLRAPEQSELDDGTYSPKLTPVNFWQSAKGTQFFTVWWAGPLAIANNRGQFQFLPQNLQGFRSADGSHDTPADPALPDHLRDVQFTINGLFQPSLRAKPGQTEIWVLENVSDLAYVNVTLTETATGRHPKIAVLAQDGNVVTKVAYPPTDDGTTLAIPPASRYAIAVTMPTKGDLVLEMPPGKGLERRVKPGVLYVNDGTEQPRARLGTVEVEASAMSYFDGFFAFPTQVLARVKPGDGAGVTTPFPEGLALEATPPFVDLAAATPAVKRELVISGGFKNEHANNQDPKSFLYLFDDNTFPNVPLLQPRLGSVEEWTFLNDNNDEHPIHVHVNDFQVIALIDPVRGIRTGVQLWQEDNVNVPAPLLEPDETVIERGKAVLRSGFTDFTGTFVIHCHRLNHEDNGLMTMVNVLPAVSAYAVATSGEGGADATVRIYDAAGDTLLATVTPFPGFAGPLSVAMGDVDGDQVLDLIAGKGPGGAPDVVSLSGAGAQPFTRELLRFVAFDAEFRGGVSVAAAVIDGNDLADNVVVGSGSGMESTVKVFSSLRPASVGTAPALFASFAPYPGSTGGVAVATGMVDAMSGRQSIVTAPGAGSAAQVKTFRFDLYRPNSGASAWCAPKDPLPPGVPLQTSEFLAFDAAYTGGVSLATGWVGAANGGAQTIVVGASAAPGMVKVFSSGSGLDGEPEVYLRSPDAHETTITFREIASFSPFGEASSGVRVAATSTVHGADVLVSGAEPAGSARVRKYGMERTPATARSLTPKLLSEVTSLSGAVGWLGGS
jgi:FtsP/CotA-like multicopper oxidase with cupredoxin domain